MAACRSRIAMCPNFMPNLYVYLAGLSHTTALIAWGAFYFRARSDGRAKLVDDDDLQWVHPPRCESIGCRSSPYGPARVEVRDESGALAAEVLTNTCNHCAIAGLKPDTRYTYSVTVKHESWGSGVRWDWDPALQGLVQRDRVYRNEFRTLPDPTAELTAPFSFMVIGDFGTGIRRPSTPTRRQLEVAQALERAVDEFDVRLVLTTGDNIYASKRFLLWTAESGDEDDDWFFTYFQPYRYVINRVPWCPSIGNHDTRETEEHDDREQVMDNFYLRERLAGEEAAGRASVSPGSSTSSASLATSSSSASTRRKRISSEADDCSSIPKHWDFMQRAFPVSAGGRPRGEFHSDIIRRSAPARSMATPIGWRAVVDLSKPAASAPASAATSTTSSTRTGMASTISSPARAARCGGGRRETLKRRTRRPGPANATSCWSRSTATTMTVRAIGESPGGHAGRHSASDA